MREKKDTRLDEKVEGIHELISEFAQSSNLAVALEIELIDFQHRADINGSFIFPAASILKLAISMSIEAKAARGGLNLLDCHSLEEINRHSKSNSVLRGLIHTKSLTTEELQRIMLIASDELATYELLEIIDLASVNEFLFENNFVDTQLEPNTNNVSVAGQTTALESLRLFKLAGDNILFPVTSSSLGNSIMNSRIPLGVTDSSIKISHKTGSLPGVANDVARLETPQGSIYLSFLSKNQEDTVITGYKMGLCTGEILRLLGLAVSRSSSVISDING